MLIVYEWTINPLSVFRFKSSNVNFQKKKISEATTMRPPQKLYAMFTFPNLKLISSGSANNTTLSVTRKRRQVPNADNVLQTVFSRDFMIKNCKFFTDYCTF